MAQPRRQALQRVGQWMIIALTIGLVACETAPPGIDPTPSPTPTEKGTPDQEPSDTSQTGTTPTPEVARLEVYWLQAADNKLTLAPAPITLPEPGEPPLKQLTLALERLLQGPANADVSTTIPNGTELNTLKIEPDGIHVDLTKEFVTGGGSTSMQGRLGQIIYTASSLDPQEAVWISIDGEPLQVLGGEGVEVSQPITRQEFQKEFSL